MIYKKKDKRKNTRFAIDIEGYYYFLFDWNKCRIYDLSIDGAGLRMNQSFVKDDMIKLKFGSQSEQIVVDAKITNINGPRIGIKFENLFDFDYDRIFKIIGNNSKLHRLLKN